jgi:hypothetical protein
MIGVHDGGGPNPATGPRRRSSRTPALVNAAATMVLVLILTTLALRAVQSPPPAVAEFAPQVQQQIKQAPGNQAGGQGAGSGPGAGTPTPAPTAQANAAASSPTPLSVPHNLIKQCVGDPPRQIEDSQSPPCIAYWNADNGGATYPGVTKDSIYVAIFSNQSPGESVRYFEDLRRFFNQRFQLYNRQLIFEYCTGQQGYSPSIGQADAANAYGGCTSSPDSSAASSGAPTGHVPFAAPVYHSQYYTFDKEIACNDHAIAISPGTLADAYLREPSNCFPYAWQYVMANENIFANTGQWVCSRLAGGTARYAAGVDGRTPAGQLNQDPRKFGLIESDIGEGAGDPTSTPDVYGRLLDELKACGVDIASQDMVVNPTPDNVATALVRMKQDNVTSVLCMAVFGTCIQAQKDADNLPYFPEWLSTTFSEADSDLMMHLLPADQRSHTLGLSFQPKQVLPQLDPWYQAVRSVDPSYVAATDSQTAFFLREQYWTLLELASGIQMAGPQLTPQAFAGGLWRTSFPNPDTSIHEGRVGFAGQSLEMTTDAAEFFVSNTASGPYSDTGAGTGVVCYVNGGARHAAGQWPKGPDSVFFTNACDSGG